MDQSTEANGSRSRAASGRLRRTARPKLIPAAHQQQPDDRKAQHQQQLPQLPGADHRASLHEDRDARAPPFEGPPPYLPGRPHSGRRVGAGAGKAHVARRRRLHGRPRQFSSNLLPWQWFGQDSRRLPFALTRKPGQHPSNTAGALCYLRRISSELIILFAAPERQIADWAACPDRQVTVAWVRCGFGGVVPPGSSRRYLAGSVTRCRNRFRE